LKENIKEGISD